jgi:hypothetical protein
MKHILIVSLLSFITVVRADITFPSLLQEMTDRSVVTHWPEHAYRSLQASSYNRASKTPDDPKGWFANADCGFSIRTEESDGQVVSVLMEHEGPGVITRIWAPFFFYDFNNRTGSDIRIYIDGNPKPVIAENFINLVTGKGSVKTAPFAQYTVRAGNLYLPIPFEKSCKIVQVGKPFFYIINYRAYEEGTEVESFRPEMLEEHAQLVEKAATQLMNPENFSSGEPMALDKTIPAGEAETIELPNGPAAVRHLEFKLASDNLPNALRSTVLEMTCDGEQTIWCPIGDFFSNVNSLDPPHKMWERETLADGTMICRWIMPYRKSAEIKIRNLAKIPVAVACRVVTSDWTWTDDTMHFFTQWWTDDPWPPRPVKDMNFIDIHGKGIHVGDTLVVLNPHWSWWGEGDEKIYIDDDIDRRFPSHFGTGSEDYYGWAGGEVPTRKDEFSSPFVANVRVGGKGRHTHGYNVCSRTRSLDATPFKTRFKFDMEAFNMIAEKTAYLQYSLVTHWYGRPGATHNRPPMPDWAAKPVPQTEDVEAFVNKDMETSIYRMPGAIELEDHVEVKRIGGLQGGRQNLESYPRLTFSGQAHYWGRADRVGQGVEFTFLEQYQKRRIMLYATHSVDYGKLNIYVNGKLVLKDWDGYNKEVKIADPIDLGVHEPDGNVTRLKIEVSGKNEASKGYFFGLDCVKLEDVKE